MINLINISNIVAPIGYIKDPCVLLVGLYSLGSRGTVTPQVLAAGHCTHRRPERRSHYTTGLFLIK